MVNHNYHRTRIIYKALQHIADKKLAMMNELAAYTKDPVRYARRLRFLRELAQYEHDLLQKFEQFTTEHSEQDFDDILLQTIIESVDLLVLQSA